MAQVLFAFGKWLIPESLYVFGVAIMFGCLIVAVAQFTAGMLLMQSIAIYTPLLIERAYVFAIGYSLFRFGNYLSRAWR